MSFTRLLVIVKMSFMTEKTALGKWSVTRIDEMLSEASMIREAGPRIAFLSGHFLGTPYKGSTLIGGPDTPEVFVVDLAGFDCFTFIDCIEAMRPARSFLEFKQRLREIRYKDGIVTYVNRNHFFTDWREHNGRFVSDATAMIGAAKTRQSTKTLNMKPDGTLFLEGIAPRSRTVTYIPSGSICADILENIQNGDYVGIYTETDGLDVSHVGIAIRQNGTVYLRHASSVAASLKVIDQLFMKYIEEKPGIVVLRPSTV